MPAHQTVDANQGWLPLAVRKAPGCKRNGRLQASATKNSSSFNHFRQPCNHPNLYAVIISGLRSISSAEITSY